MEQYLIMMCGYPGSGKSTITQKIVKEKNMKVLSMDSYREKSDGNQLDQSKNENIFRDMFLELKNSLQNGESVILDNQNINKSNRKYFTKRTMEYNVKRICICIDATIEDCMKNNKSPLRTHIVPDTYFDTIKGRLSYPTLAEGWDEVYILNIDYGTGEITVTNHFKKED